VNGVDVRVEVAMALEAYAARDWRACGENLGEVLSKLFVSVQVDVRGSSWDDTAAELLDVDVGPPVNSGDVPPVPPGSRLRDLNGALMDEKGIYHSVALLYLRSPDGRVARVQMEIHGLPMLKWAMDGPDAPAELSAQTMTGPEDDYHGEGSKPVLNPLQVVTPEDPQFHPVFRADAQAGEFLSLDGLGDGPRWLGRRGGMAVNPMRVEPFLRALVRQMEQDRSDAKLSALPRVHVEGAPQGRGPLDLVRQPARLVAGPE
jgi:hypothetical protein